MSREKKQKLNIEELLEENSRLRKNIVSMNSKYKEIKIKILKFQKEYSQRISNYKEKIKYLEETTDKTNINNKILERNLKTSSDNLKYANFDFAKSLLEPIDWLEKTLETVPKKDNPWAFGLIKVLDSFKESLDKFNIKEIEVKPGDKINVDLMEAVEIEHSNKKHSEKVSTVIQKGYTLYGRVLRFSRVKVGK